MYTYEDQAYIGICGEQGAGKSTIANIIKSQFQPRTIIKPFSEPIKKIAHDIFGVSYDDMEDPIAKNEKNIPMLQSLQNLTIRQLLQHLGSSFRKLHPNIFVYLLSCSIPKEQTIVLVPDVRYNNEYKFIKSRSGILVKVTRPDLPSNCDNHESEKEWKQLRADITIDNSKDLEYLYTQIRTKIYSIIPKQCFEKEYNGYTKVKEEDGPYFIDA